MIDTLTTITNHTQLDFLGVGINLNQIKDSGNFLKEINEPNNLAKFRFAPTNEIKRDYDYIPTIEIQLRRIDGSWKIDSLKVQCAVPKLIYGSSYYMVDENDLDKFCYKMSAMLNLAGIKIYPEQVKHLGLSRLDICHNIVLPTKFGSAYPTTKKLFNVELGKKVKKKKHTEYTQESDGIVYRQFSQNISYRFYDKVGEIINSKNRTPTDFFLLEDIKQGLLPREILRLEIIHQHKTAVKRLLKGNTDPKVKDAFSNELAKDCLLNFCKSNLDFANLLNAQDLFANNEISAESLSNLFHYVSNDLKLSGMTADFAILEAIGTKIYGSLTRYHEAYDKAFGRNQEKNRSKYKKKLNEDLSLLEISSFTLPSLAKEIIRQIELYPILKTAEDIKSFARQLS